MIQEFRRAPRRKVADTILVTDVMTERVVGRIGNLSESGMLLIAGETLVEDALYQFRFLLPEDGDKQAPVEAGVHVLWVDHASAPGQVWAGFRFISVAEQYMARLHAWIGAPGGRFE